MAKTLVSVLLPTFRRAKSGLFLKAARSVLNQSLLELELIIVDDGSTDGTADQINQLMREDDRVSCLRHPQNVGMPAISEYEGLMRARADYIAFGFDDDEFYPDALQDLLNYAVKNDSSIIHGYVDMHIYEEATRQYVKVSDFGRGLIPQALLVGTNYISNNAVLLHRRVVERVGFFDPHVALGRVCDWDLWRRTSMHFDIVAVDIPVGQVFGPSTNDSLGHTYLMEPWQILEWMNLPRNEQLLPKNLGDYDIVAVPETLSRQTKLVIEEIKENFKDKFWYPKNSMKQPFAKGTGIEDSNAEQDGHILVVTMLHDACTTLCFDHLPQFFHQRIRVVYPGHWLPEEMIGASAVIFVRNLSDFVEWIEYARKLKIPHYYFLDDNLMVLRNEPAYRSVFSSFTDETVRETLKSFSGVLLSSYALMDYFKTKKLHENLLYYPPVAKRAALYEIAKGCQKKENAMRIAYFGGGHRNQPFKEMVFPAICEFAQHHLVELFIGGMSENSLDPPEALSITYFPFDISYDHALGRFAACEIDILVHPNSNTINNSYKTLNVLINAMAMNAIPILSDDPPYDNLRSEKVALLCSRDSSSWLEAVQVIYDEPETVEIIRRNLEKFCYKHFSGDANVGALMKILQASPSPGLVLRDTRYRTLVQILRRLNTQPPQQSLTPQTTARYGIVESPPNPPASDLLVDEKAIYHFNPQHPNWIGLDVLIGTQNRTATGVLKMRVLSKTGRPLREISIDLVHARDNDWLEFRFPPIANSASIPFVVEFTTTNLGPQTRIIFYESNTREDPARRLLRRAGMRLPGNKLYCRTWYAK